MTYAQVEFETTLGDELSVEDLQGATYKIVESFVDYNPDDEGLVITHRVEIHSTDDQIVAMIEERYTDEEGGDLE